MFPVETDGMPALSGYDYLLLSGSQVTVTAGHSGPKTAPETTGEAQQCAGGRGAAGGGCWPVCEAVMTTTPPQKRATH